MAKTKIAILTYQDKFEKYDDEFKDAFEHTEVLSFGSDFSYETMIENAKKIEREGYDAVIARGYSYSILKDYVAIPIVVVEPDILDVIGTVIENKFGSDTPLTLLMHVSNSLMEYTGLKQYMFQLFGVETIIKGYFDMEEYFRLVDEAIESDTILLTGYNGLKRAKERNARAGALFVGENAMRNAVTEALRIIQVRRRDALQRRKLETILNTHSEGIVSIDRSGEIKLINARARKLLNLDGNVSFGDAAKINHWITGVNWDTVFEESSRKIIADTLSGTQLIINTTTAADGEEAVISFREVDKVVEDEKRIRANLYKKGQVAKYTLDDIKGHSSVIRECKSEALSCARFDVNVLIYGESGTGKELLAQSIHNASMRKNEPFYAINCAALPESLLESELFGYSEGAFTGAKKGGKAGIFEMAHRGTIYLDEIGELSMASQSALLRVLQEKEVRRIGDDTLIPVDVRVIAASHRNIYMAVTRNEFRQDLFYRLNTVYLTLPPLRQRREDIFELLDYLIEKYSGEYKMTYSGTFTGKAREFLFHYEWQGNIRELQNFVKRVFALGYREKVLDVDEVKILLRNSPGPIGLSPLIQGGEKSVQRQRGHISIGEAERAVRLAGGNKAEAARQLGISRTQLWRLLKKE